MQIYGMAGLVMMVLALSACGRQDVQPEAVQNMGIPIAGTESFMDEPENGDDLAAEGSSASGTMQPPEDGISNIGNEEQDNGYADSQQQDVPASGSLADDGLLQPAYIGDWKVVEYCYPSTPCGLSQEEVDALIGSELTYASESFSFNQKVVQSEVIGYEFSFYDSLEEYKQDYNVSVDNWFADGDTGMVKCGYLAMEEDVFGNRFAWMEEQPDKMLIYYYGVVFLAVNNHPQENMTTGSLRGNAYLEALENLLFYQQLPIGQETENIPVTVYFAIQDIDGDGRDELLINYQGSVMAAIQEMAYDYDESGKELYREIWDFPDILFYANGYARSDWSHNQTRSDVWPYNLYWYDNSSDQYELAYAVTAWDKELSETDSEGNPFPDEADISGTGRVYLIGDHRTGEALKPMDVTEYEKWYADLMGEGAVAEISVEWQLLDAINLKSLQSQLSSVV